MVFAGPAVFVLVGEGVEVFRQYLAHWKVWASWALVALLLLPGLLDSTFHIFYPRFRHEIRPMIEYVQQYREPGDQLLVFVPATFEFYTGENFRDMNIEPISWGRVWVLASGPRHTGYPEELEDLLHRLSTRRKQLGGIKEYGAVAFLFGPTQLRGEPG